MNPALSFVHKLTNTGSWGHLKGMAFGLAEDFWHDGPENPLMALWPRKSETFFETPFAAAIKTAKGRYNKSKAFTASADLSSNEWHAENGAIAEILWGEGWVIPADQEISEKLVQPLSLKSRMSVLDLSAGLGTRARQMADNFDVLVTGLEVDPEIALRGMTLSIETNKGRMASIANYDPMTFRLNKGYDVILARELLYRMDPKDEFLQSLALCANKDAFVSFTDYVVDPEQVHTAGIKAWLAYEKQAKPIGLIQMGEVWAKAGFYLINQEDLTALYKKEILSGMRRLVVFLSTSQKPDAPTKFAVKQQLKVWMHRLTAIESGMRIFRFLGTKQS